MKYSDIESNVGFRLPSIYKKCVAERSADTYFAQDVAWKLYAIDELIEVVTFSGRRARRYQLVQAHMEDARCSSVGSLPHGMMQGVCIGEGLDGDLLFLNQKLAVNAYFVSSNEVVELSGGFEEFLGKRMEALREVEEDLPIVGYWVADSSTTTPMDEVNYLFPMYIFEKEGTGKVEFLDPDTGELDEALSIEWSLVEDAISEAPCILVNQSKFYIDELDASWLTLSNEVRDLVIRYRKVVEQGARSNQGQLRRP